MVRRFTFLSLNLLQKSENTLKPSASIGVASARYLRLLYDSKISARGLLSRSQKQEVRIYKSEDIHSKLFSVFKLSNEVERVRRALQLLLSKILKTSFFLSFFSHLSAASTGDRSIGSTSTAIIIFLTYSQSTKSMRYAKLLTKMRIQAAKNCQKP
jgi:hypothetical protein